MFQDFNRQGHQRLSAEITFQLQELARRHGLDIVAGGGTIGDTELVIKVTARTNDTSMIEAKARQELSWAGRGLGLEPGDYGAVFTSQRGQYRFTGVSPNRPKYPIDGVCLRTGKKFKFPRQVANNIIAVRKAAAPTQPTTPVMQLPQGFVAPSSGLDDRYVDAAQF